MLGWIGLSGKADEQDHKHHYCKPTDEYQAPPPPLRDDLTLRTSSDANVRGLCLPGIPWSILFIATVLRTPTSAVLL